MCAGTPATRSAAKRGAAFGKQVTGVVVVVVYFRIIADFDFGGSSSAHI